MARSARMLTAVLGLCLCMVTAGYSQSYFGPKLGLTLADVRWNEGDVDVDTRSNPNLAIGLALDLGILPVFSIQPEVMYLGRGFKFEAAGVEIRQNIAYIDLGALAKIRFGVENPIGGYIGAGPFFNYALSGKVKIEGQDDQDIEFGDTDFKRTDFSVAGALGLTFNIGGPLFLVEGRYIAGLNDINGGDDTEIKNQTIGINVGFMVPLQ